MKALLAVLVALASVAFAAVSSPNAAAAEAPAEQPVVETPEAQPEAPVVVPAVPPPIAPEAPPPPPIVTPEPEPEAPQPPSEVPAPDPAPAPELIAVTAPAPVAVSEPPPPSIAVETTQEPVVVPVPLLAPAHPPRTRRAAPARPAQGPGSFRDCTQDPAANDCYQLVGTCRSNPRAPGCEELYGRCRPLRNDPSARFTAPECAAYQDVELCLEQPLSSSCDSYLERPCARNGGKATDDSPACQIRRRIAELRRRELEEREGGAHGGETRPDPPISGGGVSGPVSGPVATAALIVELRRRLDGNVTPQVFGHVTLAFARAQVTGSTISLSLYCPSRDFTGKVSLTQTRESGELGAIRFRCTGKGVKRIRVELTSQEQRRLTAADPQRVWVRIAERDPLGRRHSSLETVALT